MHCGATRHANRLTRTCTADVVASDYQRQRWRQRKQTQQVRAPSKHGSAVTARTVQTRSVRFVPYWFVCLLAYLKNHPTNFRACCPWHGSVLLWRRCGMLRASGFADDAVFFTLCTMRHAVTEYHKFITAKTTASIPTKFCTAPSAQPYSNFMPCRSSKGEVSAKLVKNSQLRATTESVILAKLLYSGLWSVFRSSCISVKTLESGNRARQ